MIKEKKALINKVKETETYKKVLTFFLNKRNGIELLNIHCTHEMTQVSFQAQEILEKFDPDTRLRKAQAEQQRMMNAVLQQSGEISDPPNTSVLLTPKGSLSRETLSTLPTANENGLLLLFAILFTSSAVYVHTHVI